MNKKLEALISLGLIGAVCAGGYLLNRNGKPIIERRDNDSEIRYADESFCKDPYVRCTVTGESGSFLDYKERGGSKKNLEYDIHLKRDDNNEYCIFHVLGSLGECKELSDAIGKGTNLCIHEEKFREHGFFDSSRGEGYILPVGLNIVR